MKVLSSRVWDCCTPSLQGSDTIHSKFPQLLHYSIFQGLLLAVVFGGFFRGAVTAIQEIGTRAHAGINHMLLVSWDLRPHVRRPSGQSPTLDLSPVQRTGAKERLAALWISLYKRGHCQLTCHRLTINFLFSRFLSSRLDVPAVVWGYIARGVLHKTAWKRWLWRQLLDMRKLHKTQIKLEKARKKVLGQAFRP